MAKRKTVKTKSKSVKVKARKAAKKRAVKKQKAKGRPKKKKARVKIFGATAASTFHPGTAADDLESNPEYSPQDGEVDPESADEEGYF